MKAHGYAATDAKSPLAPYSFERRAPAANEVRIDIQYCGVCHSDVHQARNEWHNTIYPCVPGHEIIGTVAEIGAEVTHFKQGDTVGVGCLVDSCGRCDSCEEGLQQYCTNGWTGTYNGPSIPDGTNTYGGYSNCIVVREDFVLRLPEGMDAKSAAPLLCAGVTTYSPLRHWKVGQGDQVGVVALGGLGHMAVKLAAAMGAEVTLFTTSPEKTAEAKRLGAKAVVISTDEKAMEASAGAFDYIISTVPASHDLNPYVPLLKRDGMMTLVGCLEPLSKPLEMGPFIMQRRSVSGSLIGGIAETQEALDFCAEHGIAADVEMIAIKDINQAFDRVVKGEVHYRFVIDMSTLDAA